MTLEDVQKHRKAGDKIIFVDARAQATDVIIPGAVHVPNEQIDEWTKGTPKVSRGFAHAEGAAMPISMTTTSTRANLSSLVSSSGTRVGADADGARYPNPRDRRKPRSEI